MTRPSTTYISAWIAPLSNASQATPPPPPAVNTMLYSLSSATPVEVVGVDKLLAWWAAITVEQVVPYSNSVVLACCEEGTATGAERGRIHDTSMLHDCQCRRQLGCTSCCC
jgi:hypothetical protein